MQNTINLQNLTIKEIKKIIKSGNPFVYPTDTGYCLGCGALNISSIELTKKISTDKTSQLSIVAPSKEWIYKNFKIKNKNYIKKLPGPFTFILEAKKKTLAKKFCSKNKEVRIKIPNHKFHNLIKKVGIPITSIEIKNKLKNIPSTNQLSRKLIKKIIIIESGYIKKSPSAILNLIKDTPSIVGR